MTVQPALLKHRLVPLSGEVLAQPSRLDLFPYATCDNMAACSNIVKKEEQDHNSVTERVNELFEKLAHTGRVKPEPPLFVLELKKP